MVLKTQASLIAFHTKVNKYQALTILPWDEFCFQYNQVDLMFEQ